MLDFLVEQAEKDCVEIRRLLQLDFIGGKDFFLNGALNLIFNRDLRIEAHDALRLILINIQQPAQNEVAPEVLQRLKARILYEFYVSYAARFQNERVLQKHSIKAVILNTFSRIQEELKAIGIEAFELTCPITGELLIDPVVASDGHTYERHAIWQWMCVRLPQGPVTSPMTREVLQYGILFPNYAIKRIIARLPYVAPEHLLPMQESAQGEVPHP